MEGRAGHDEFVVLRATGSGFFEGCRKIRGYVGLTRSVCLQELEPGVCPGMVLPLLLLLLLFLWICRVTFKDLSERRAGHVIVSLELVSKFLLLLLGDGRLLGGSGHLERER